MQRGMSPSNHLLVRRSEWEDDQSYLGLVWFVFLDLQVGVCLKRMKNLKGNIKIEKDGTTCIDIA